MKKFRNLFLFFAFFLGSFGVASAQKFAVVDIKRIEDDSIVTKNLRDQVLAAGEDLEKQVQLEREKAEKKIRDLQATLANVTPAKREQMQQDLQKELSAMEASLQEKAKSLDIAKFEALEKINDKIRSISADIAKSKGYDMVLTSSFMIYYPSENDITSEVISRLNKEIPSVKLNAQQAAKQAQKRK